MASGIFEDHVAENCVLCVHQARDSKKVITVKESITGEGCIEGPVSRLEELRRRWLALECRLKQPRVSMKTTVFQSCVLPFG